MCNGKCKGCAYYVLDSDSVACHTGTCHFLPPSVVLILDRQEPVVAVWPAVCSDDFCGQWESVEEVDEMEEDEECCGHCLFWDCLSKLCNNRENHRTGYVKKTDFCDYFCRKD